MKHQRNHIYSGNKNKGKFLYYCPDCGERHYLKPIELNRRNGDRCYGCGGRLQASSQNAMENERIGADHRNEPETGSIKRLV